MNILDAMCYYLLTTQWQINRVQMLKQQHSTSCCTTFDANKQLKIMLFIKNTCTETVNSREEQTFDEEKQSTRLWWTHFRKKHQMVFGSRCLNKLREKTARKETVEPINLNLVVLSPPLSRNQIIFPSLPFSVICYWLSGTPIISNSFPWGFKIVGFNFNVFRHTKTKLLTNH